MLSDYADIQVPIVLIMNMIDIAHQQGKTIDIEELQKALNIPVIPIVAADKKEYAALYDFLEHGNGVLLKDEMLKTLYEDTLGEKYRILETYIPKDGIGVFSQTWIVSKLVEKDQKVIELVQKAVDAAQFKNIESALQDSLFLC